MLTRTIHALLLASAAALCAAAPPPPNLKLDQDALDLAQRMERSFANVVDSAKPAVVVITNKQVAPQVQQLPEEFYQFFGIPRQYQRQRSRRQRPVPAGKGSGVLISREGYLVTNCHVIADHNFLEVKTSDGTVYDNERNKDEVQVVGVDEATDLAVLRIGGKGRKDFPYLEFADSDRLRVGQWTIAIGAPFNFDYSVTIGCISQKGRYDTGMSTLENYIQTDASINPGNSGGPLLDIRGQIIGINQFIYTGGMSKGSIGLGFAISSNLVRQVSEAIIKDGAIVRPFLGIAMQEITDELKAQFQVDYGVLVSEVLPGEGAEKAGVRAGDIIQKIGDHKVTSNHDLLLHVTRYQPGDRIVLGVVRDGRRLDIRVKAGRRDDGQAANGAYDRRSRDSEGHDARLGRLGLRLEVEKKEVVVGAVLPDGAVARASRAGSPYDSILPGDVVLEVNRCEVHSVTEVMDALKKTRNDNVMFYIKRPTQQGSYRFFISIPLKETR